MKILFVHPSVEMSIADVARGYRSALERQGHDIADYRLVNRFDYHCRAMPPGMNDPALLSRLACENLVCEALYHHAELVIIPSGLNFHPIGMWLMGEINVPVAAILTESPYDDDHQAVWADLSHTDSKVNLTLFTNDRYSAMRFGWHYLPPSFDPNVHKPMPSNPEFESDVVMVGTGWADRQAFLEAIDWTGINLKLYGVWPGITPESPLAKFYQPSVVNNEHAVEIYCSSKVCVNLNRASEVAMTPGPRVYELAACGAFQLSDARREMTILLGDSVPTFDNPQTLEAKIRYYLSNPAEREELAGLALQRVQAETFDNRATKLMAMVTQPV